MLCYRGLGLSASLLAGGLPHFPHLRCRNRATPGPGSPPSTPKCAQGHFPYTGGGAVPVHISTLKKRVEPSCLGLALKERRVKNKSMD